jgi:hypothetical protein
MRTALSSVAVAALALSACANPSGARMGLFTTTTPVVAIVGGELYTGESVCFLDGTGRLDLHASTDPAQACSGRFRYESDHLGVGDMRCNGKTDASFQFRALSTMTGYGFGRAQEAEVSFAYGMTPEQATPYLRLPSGKKLRRKDSGLVLSDG